MHAVDEDVFAAFSKETPVATIHDAQHRMRHWHREDLELDELHPDLVNPDAVKEFQVDAKIQPRSSLTQRHVVQYAIIGFVGGTNGSPAVPVDRLYMMLREKQNKAWASESVATGVKLAHEGHTDRAMNAYRHALEIDAKCVDAHIAIGAALSNATKYAKAIKSFEQALMLDPLNTNAFNYLESTLNKSDDREFRHTAFYRNILRKRELVAPPEERKREASPPRSSSIRRRNDRSRSRRRSRDRRSRDRGGRFRSPARDRYRSRSRNGRRDDRRRSLSRDRQDRHSRSRSIIRRDGRRQSRSRDRRRSHSRSPPRNQTRQRNRESSPPNKNGSANGKLADSQQRPQSPVEKKAFAESESRVQDMKPQPLTADDAVVTDAKTNDKDPQSPAKKDAELKSHDERDAKRTSLGSRNQSRRRSRSRSRDRHERRRYRSRSRSRDRHGNRRYRSRSRNRRNRSRSPPRRSSYRPRSRSPPRRRDRSLPRRDAANEMPPPEKIKSPVPKRDSSPPGQHVNGVSSPKHNSASPHAKDVIGVSSPASKKKPAPSPEKTKSPGSKRNSSPPRQDVNGLSSPKQNPAPPHAKIEKDANGVSSPTGKQNPAPRQDKTPTRHTNVDEAPPPKETPKPLEQYLSAANGVPKQQK